MNSNNNIVTLDSEDLSGLAPEVCNRIREIEQERQRLLVKCDELLKRSKKAAASQNWEEHYKTLNEALDIGEEIQELYRAMEQYAMLAMILPPSDYTPPTE